MDEHHGITLGMGLVILGLSALFFFAGRRSWWGEKDYATIFIMRVGGVYTLFLGVYAVCSALFLP